MSDNKPANSSAAGLLVVDGIGIACFVLGLLALFQGDIETGMPLLFFPVLGVMVVHFRK
jgi:hypothetical protein